MVLSIQFTIVSFPFLLGYAVRLAVEKKVRYGEKLLLLNGGLIEIY